MNVTTKPEQSIEQIVQRIGESDGDVTIMASGGSSLSFMKDLLGKIVEEGLANRLAPLLIVDERYGEQGHKDSNGAALVGIANELGDLKVREVLLSPLLPIEETTKLYSEHVQSQLSSSSLSIAVLGMGGDSHTAGILPMNDAEKFEDLFLGDERFAYFEAYDYRRITSTYALLESLDHLYCYIEGDSKLEVAKGVTVNDKAHEKPISGLLDKITWVYKD